MSYEFDPRVVGLTLLVAVASLAISVYSSPAAVLAPFLAASDGTLALVRPGCAAGGCLGLQWLLVTVYVTSTAVLVALAVVWVGRRVCGTATRANENG